MDKSIIFSSANSWSIFFSLVVVVVVDIKYTKLLLQNYGILCEEIVIYVFQRGAGPAVSSATTTPQKTLEMDMQIYE